MVPAVDIVIPVLNEEKGLPQSMMILSQFLHDNLSRNPWRIVIADNGSTDNTGSVSEMLAQKYPGISYVYIPQRGRGRALRTAWLESDADIVSYMDVDLSTDLNSFPRLIQAIEEGYDIAIGSRLSARAKVRRSLKREVISRSYNMMIKSLFFVSFSDAQCGFKAVSRNAAQALVPLVKNNNWFFDTELLIIAAKREFRIREIPVDWVEDPDSRVKVLRTAWEDFKGLMRLRFGSIPSVPANVTAGRD